MPIDVFQRQLPISPVRFHRGKCAYNGVRQRKRNPTAFLRFVVAQAFKRVQKSSLFPIRVNYVKISDSALEVLWGGPSRGNI